MSSSSVPSNRNVWFFGTGLQKDVLITTTEHRIPPQTCLACWLHIHRAFYSRIWPWGDHLPPGQGAVGSWVSTLPCAPRRRSHRCACDCWGEKRAPSGGETPLTLPPRAPESPPHPPGTSNCHINGQAQAEAWPLSREPLGRKETFLWCISPGGVWQHSALPFPVSLFCLLLPLPYFPHFCLFLELKVLEREIILTSGNIHSNAAPTSTLLVRKLTATFPTIPKQRIIYTHLYPKRTSWWWLDLLNYDSWNSLLNLMKLLNLALKCCLCTQSSSCFMQLKAHKHCNK